MQFYLRIKSQLLERKLNDVNLIEKLVVDHEEVISLKLKERKNWLSLVSPSKSVLLDIDS